MGYDFRTQRAADMVPFDSGEAAWFWAMATLLARRDGADAAWQPDGMTRPCEPDDVVNLLDSLYRRGGMASLHVRTLRVWGVRQMAPNPALPEQRGDARLWQQAMGQLEWALRGRGIVR